MTTEEKLRELILSKYGTLKDFVPLTGLSYSTVDTILRRGIRNSSIANVYNICNALQISTDSLAKGYIKPLKSKNEYVINDLRDYVKNCNNSLLVYQDFSIDGVPVTHNDVKMFINAMNIALDILKKSKEGDEE